MTRFGAGYLIPMDNFEMLINRDTERRFGQLIGMKYDVSKQVIRDKNHRKRVFHFLKYGDFGKYTSYLASNKPYVTKTTESKYFIFWNTEICESIPPTWLPTSHTWQTNHRKRVFHFLKYWDLGKIYILPGFQQAIRDKITEGKYFIFWNTEMLKNTSFLASGKPYATRSQRARIAFFEILKCWQHTSYPASKKGYCQDT